jgi:hypothetical protein
MSDTFQPAAPAATRNTEIWRSRTPSAAWTALGTG